MLDGFELAAKEGLALLGNNAFSTALAALALADAMRLLAVLDVAALLDLEALAGNVSALARRSEFAALLEGSYLWDDGAARNLQDPLSFRCIPQVRTAARDAFAFARRRVETELNASQENPLVLLDEGRLDLGRQLRRAAARAGARLRARSGSRRCSRARPSAR